MDGRSACLCRHVSSRINISIFGSATARAVGNAAYCILWSTNLNEKKEKPKVSSFALPAVAALHTSTSHHYFHIYVIPQHTIIKIKNKWGGVSFVWCPYCKLKELASEWRKKNKASFRRKEGILQKMSVLEWNGWMELELPKYAEERSNPQVMRGGQSTLSTRRIRVFILKRSTLNCNWTPMRGEVSLRCDH